MPPRLNAIFVNISISFRLTKNPGFLILGHTSSSWKIHLHRRECIGPEPVPINFGTGTAEARIHHYVYHNSKYRNSLCFCQAKNGEFSKKNHQDVCPGCWSVGREVTRWVKLAGRNAIKTSV